MISEWQLAAGFRYTIELRDTAGHVLGGSSAKNLFPLEGRNYILSAAIGAGQQIPAWYIGIFKANYTPTDGDTMATFPAAASEVTQYAEASRRLLVPNPPAGGVLDSVGHEVVFTLGADATIYGAFIASSQTKGSASGVLLSAVSFTNPQQGFNGQTVTIGAVCTLINV